jgi:hypothetical protein
MRGKKINKKIVGGFGKIIVQWFETANFPQYRPDF